MAPITDRAYRAVPERSWLGRHVRVLIPIKNGWATIAVGTIATIKRKFSGFSIETEKCRHCGVKVWASKVPPYYLEDAE